MSSARGNLILGRSLSGRLQASHDGARMGATTLGGLLAGARKFFQGLAPSGESPSQPYRIVCHCGQKLSGDRTTSYQALRCPNCGGGLFVLPKSPLPEPAPASPGATDARAAAPRKSKRVDDAPVALRDFVAKPEPSYPPADDEIQWDDEIPADQAESDSEAPEPGEGKVDPVEAAMSETPGPATGKGRRVRGTKPNDETIAPSKDRKSAPEPIVARQSLGEFLAKNRNSVLLTLVAAVVFGTVALRVYRSQWQKLPAVAELGRTEGLEALDAGEFDKANQLLSDARRAVELLGDAYQGAEAIKQGAKEAAIIAKLVPEGLEDLLEDANQSEKPDWESRFKTLYQGRTVIVEGHVATIPDGRGDGVYTLDYRILPAGEGGEPRTKGEIDLKGFRLLEILKPKLGDTLTFGAKLESFQFDSERKCWVVGFDPDSGVTMTHEKALEALGWPSANDNPPSETVR